MLGGPIYSGFSFASSDAGLNANCFGSVHSSFVSIAIAYKSWVKLELWANNILCSLRRGIDEVVCLMTNSNSGVSTG